MPRWESITLGDGTVRHELNGQRAGVRVHALPDERATIVYVVVQVDGTDEATVDRCKIRAEQLLIAAQRGEVRT